MNILVNGRWENISKSFLRKKKKKNRFRKNPFSLLKALKKYSKVKRKKRLKNELRRRKRTERKLKKEKEETKQKKGKRNIHLPTVFAVLFNIRRKKQTRSFF